MKSRFLLSLLLTWLVCGGCYTQPMWHDATRKTLQRPVICGSLPASPAEGRPAQWLLRYSTRPRFSEMFAIHLLPEQEFYFMMATGVDDAPGSPFRYDPQQRQWSDILTAIPYEQRASVEAEQLVPVPRDVALKLLARQDFVAAEAMRLRFNDWRHDQIKGGGDGSVVWAYSTNVSANAASSPLLPANGETQEERWQATTNPTLAPDAMIVLLPYTQPRPSTNRAKAITGAVLLTPATAVVDGVTLAAVGVAAGVMWIIEIF